jgi:hypothetical protein
MGHYSVGSVRKSEPQSLVNTPTPEDGNRSSFRNDVFFNTGRWTNPKVIRLISVDRHQNCVMYCGGSKQTKDGRCGGPGDIDVRPVTS